MNQIIEMRQPLTETITKTFNENKLKIDLEL